MGGRYLSCLRKEEINSPEEVFAQAPFHLPLAFCRLENKSSLSDMLPQNNSNLYQKSHMGDPACRGDVARPETT